MRQNFFGELISSFEQRKLLVHIAAAGGVDLAYTGNQNIQRLTVAGVPQAAGVYGSSAQNPSNVFAGPGTVTVESGAVTAKFKRGDLNNDGAQDLSDAIMLLGFLYLGQPATLICEAAGRLNEGNDVDLSDAIYLLGFLYLGTAAPPYAGYPGCEEFPDCPKGKFCP